MRRKDKEIINREIINEILSKADICRLGLVDNGEAYIVPVNFAFQKEYIYIHSAMNGHKIEILKKNNKVTFEVEIDVSIQTGPKPCDWNTRYRSVMGKGIIDIETETELKKQALDLIMQKYGWGSKNLVYDEASLSRICILKLKINSLSGKQSGNWE